MTDEPKRRTLLVTMEVDVQALGDDDLADLVEGDESIEDVAAAVLDEAEARDVAECIEQGAYDPENFGGSALYLKVADARIVTAEWQEKAP